MSDTFPQMVDQRNPTMCGLSVSAVAAKLCGMAEDRTDYPEIGIRLRAIREGFSDMNQSGWAEKHGFGVTQWNNWEKGARRISVDAAERLCSTYGLSLDFIYLGRRDGLSDKASKVL